MTKEANKFSISKRLKSFGYAISGLKLLFKYEHNLRIHLFAAVFTVIMGFIFKLTGIEWSIILIVISIVFIAEIINSSIEYLADFVSPEFSSLIKIIKDYAAAAVLIAAVFSIIIGLIIFLPKFLT
jgi:diacylglycerol kinase